MDFCLYSYYTFYAILFISATNFAERSASKSTECQFDNNIVLQHDVLPCSSNGTYIKVRKRFGKCAKKSEANESENVYEPCRYEECIQKTISEPIYIRPSVVNETIIGSFPPLLDCTEILLANNTCHEYNKTIVISTTGKSKDLKLSWDDCRKMHSVTDNSQITISAEELQSFPQPIVLQGSVIELSENIPLQTRENEERASVILNESYIPKLPGIILVAIFRNLTRNTTREVFHPVSLNTIIHFDLQNDKSLLSYGDKHVVEITRQCISWDPSSGNWTHENCKNVSDDPNEVICECRDSVAYAVRYQIIHTYRTPLLHTLIRISAAFFVISVVFLLISLYCLIKFSHKLTRDLAVVQISVNLSVFLMYLIGVFLYISLEVKVDNTACEIVAVVDNYLAIAVQFNTLIQGILMYIKICLAGKLQSGNDVERRYLIILLCFAWISPAIIVLITAAVGFSNRTYMDERVIYKYLETKFGQVPSSIARYNVCSADLHIPVALSVAIPLFFVFTVNSYIIIKIARIIWRKSVPSSNMRPRNAFDERKNSDTYIRFRRTSRAIVILSLSLQSPFLISVILVLTYDEHIAIVFHGLIFGSQGVVIFFLYCILNSSIRSEIKGMLCVWNRNK